MRSFQGIFTHLRIKSNRTFDSTNRCRSLSKIELNNRGWLLWSHSSHSRDHAAAATAPNIQRKPQAPKSTQSIEEKERKIKCMHTHTYLRRICIYFSAYAWSMTMIMQFSFHFILFVFIARVFVFHLVYLVLLVWLSRWISLSMLWVQLLLGNRWKNAGSKTTNSLCIERKRWARTVARACIALNCTSKREQTVLTLETRWLKRFPRNFGISAVFNYAEVLNFRWPFGCTSCIFHFAELRADYNFVDALNAIAK